MTGGIMDNWREDFTSKVLKQSRDYIKSIENIYILDNHVNAGLRKSSYFFVSITLTDENRIKFMNCSCRKNSHCKHQAAVLTYIEENNLIETEKEFQNTVEHAEEHHLREYIRDVLNHNPEIKKDFLDKFKKEKRIDSSKYYTKLEGIIESAENYGYGMGKYDIDRLAGGIYNFILHDLYDLLSIRQYEVICELLNRIGEVLNDEVYVNEGSWFDTCEEYLILSYKLEETYVLSEEQLDKLSKNTSFMLEYM